MDRITQDLRIWLSAPNLKVGLVAYDSERNRFFELYKNSKRSFVLDQLSTCKKEDLLCNTYSKKLIEQQEVYIETDLSNAENIDRIIIQRLIDKNVRSFILAPLTDGDKTIGLLELTSSFRCELNVIHQPKLNEIIPLFNVALTRSIDERTTQVEALVQKNFTSIHPSVSWRFTEVAEDYLLQKSQGQGNNLDDNIRFKDVYPLYGQFDIRGSGRARNKAIQHDLKLQFQYIKEVLRTAIEKEDLPVYQQLIF